MTKNTSGQLDLKKINEGINYVLSILSKLTIAILVIWILIIVIKISNQEGFWIGKIEVPSTLEEDGISGVVVARLLVDEVERIEEGAYYKLNEINWQQFVDENNSLSGALSFAGIEFQIEELLRYVGIDKKKIINGELLLSGNVLRLNIRVPGEGRKTFEASYDDVNNVSSRNDAFDSLISEAGAFIVEKTNPMTLAYYHYSDFNDEGIARAIEISNDVIASNHRDSSFAHHLIAERNYFHYADTKASFVHINEALEINDQFSTAWFFKGFITLYPHGVEITGQPLQTEEEIYGEMSKEDRIRQAILCYETGLRYAPNDFSALITLAEIYVVEKANPTESDIQMAEAYVRRASIIFDEYFEQNPIKVESIGQERLNKNSNDY